LAGRRFTEPNGASWKRNLDLALSEEARPGATRKLSGRETALLVATVCSRPPEGRKRWTLDLLAGAMIGLTEHEGLSRETIRRHLAEDDLKPWLRKMWCIPQVDGAYVARMEDVLDLYAEEADPMRPVVCFDESPTQLIGELREPIPAAPGRPERYDCEYRRNGTANLFVFLDAHKSWRQILAPCESDGSADSAGFRCLHARSGRYSRSGRGANPRGDGQSFDSHSRGLVRSFPGS
jgi:hypothetical protein